jgi:hypothetical protein
MIPQPGASTQDARRGGAGLRPGSTPPPQQLHPPGTAAGCTDQMTGNDLIVIAPWVIFGAALAIVLARLLSSRRRGGRW